MESNSVEKALSSFSCGFNCAQAVLLGISNKLDIDEELALGIAGAMGGGVRCGEMCGAVLGASVAVGMEYGQKNPEDTVAKATCTEKTKELTSCFKDKFGAITCVDLLGYNVNTLSPEEFVKVKEEKAVKCSAYIRESVEILEKIL